MKQYVATANDGGMRLSRFVQRVTAGLPEAVMYRHFRSRRIKVNGRRAAPDLRLAPGDVVELYLNDEFFPGDGPASRRADSAGAAVRFDVAYEDENLAVLYKPAGVLSHRGDKGQPALLDAFTAGLVRRGVYLPAAENTFAPALCNRLDRGTEGLLLAAKTAAALRDMNEIIRLRLLAKIYLCVCAGAPPQGTFHAWHARERATHTVRIFGQETPGAKPITTEVAVMEQAGGLSLCRVCLHTGRTHQIRAHLAFLGAPLAGDAKYGGPGARQTAGLASPALCAWRLAFSPGLPAGNTLAYLAGKSFTASMASLPGWWAARRRGP